VDSSTRPIFSIRVESVSTRVASKNDKVCTACGGMRRDVAAFRLPDFDVVRLGANCENSQWPTRRLQYFA
jgi:hypothetical protein